MVNLILVTLPGQRCEEGLGNGMQRLLEVLTAIDYCEVADRRNLDGRGSLARACRGRRFGAGRGV